MAVNQSQIQSLIEGLTSVNSNAQQAQPNNPNNGNPGGIYNIPAQSDAYGNWWIPPGQTGVNFAGIVPPPTGGNTNINSILSNLYNPVGAGPINNNPPGGTTPPPTGPGTGPGTGSPPPNGTGTAGIPAGPISGPTWQNPHNWQGNYNNANPSIPTSPFGNWYGQQGPTLTNPRTISLANLISQQTGVNILNPSQNGSGGFNLNMGNIGTTMRNWLSNLSQEALQGLGFNSADGKFDWRQFLDAVTELWVPGDFYNSETGTWNSPGDMLAGMMPSWLTDRIQREAPQVWQQTQQRLNDTYRNTAQNAINRIASPNRFNAQAYYNAQPQMSRQEWDRLNRHFDTIRLLTGGGHDWMQNQMDAATRRIYQIFGNRSFRER